METIIAFLTTFVILSPKKPLINVESWKPFKLIYSHMNHEMYSLLFVWLEFKNIITQLR